MINFSELLWKPQRSKVGRMPESAAIGSEDRGEPYELQRVPVEEVQIRPELRIALLTDPRSPGADRFRYLRMRLRELKASPPSR
jgi:hypothetical protein